MPSTATYEEAAALPVGGMTTLEILKKGNIQPGDKVLIYGASGSVGTYGVQIARNYYGAEVTGVCSTANTALVQSLGAQHVIDYTEEEFPQTGQTYDVIFDAVGKISLPEVTDILAENGSYLTVQTTTRESLENLRILKDLFERGKIKPVIDKRFPLEQTADAHRYVETGRKKGNVVITLNGS
jgi:NADPH:quinone reductase-like Zn-dependent oxidoreductase